MIRPALLPDIPAIHQLILDASQHHKVLPRPIPELTQVINSFFVYEINPSPSTIIACASLEVYSPRIAEIRSLVVHPDHQGQGIGKLLIQACIDAAKQQHIYEVLTITDRDYLFEKLGFDKCLGGQYPMFLRP